MYQTGLFKGMNYLIRYPKGYVPGEKCPVIILMHGAGTRGQRQADGVSRLWPRCLDRHLPKSGGLCLVAFPSKTGRQGHQHRLYRRQNLRIKYSSGSSNI